MLEYPDMVNLLDQRRSVRTIDLGTISRDDVCAIDCTIHPQRLASPALLCYNTDIVIRDEDTVLPTKKLESFVRPTYWVNDKFPNPLQTAEQNYWLGFLMCDGYIQRSNNVASLGLELAVKDAYIVSNFAEFLGTKAYSSRNRVRALRVCTKELRLLQDHGLFPKKTGKESYPNTVTNDGAFLRGVLDGDGSMSVSNNRCMSLSFVSQSASFLASIAYKLFFITGSECWPKKITGKNCFRVDYSMGHGKSLDLYKFLYSDSGPRLHRKQRILKLFCERPKPCVGRPKLSTCR